MLTMQSSNKASGNDPFLMVGFDMELLERPEVPSLDKLQHIVEKSFLSVTLMQALQ